MVFGLGPSSAIADYFAIQLGRFGVESASLTQTGLLLADGLHRLRRGDLIVMLAYSRVYRELATLLTQADRLGLAKILLTDTLSGVLGKKVDLILPVARGNADWFSTHMMPAELQSIHRFVLDTAVIESISDEMRAVVETVWPELCINYR